MKNVSTLPFPSLMNVSILPAFRTRSNCNGHMNLKKRSAPLVFLLALSLALISVFSGSAHFVAAAQSLIPRSAPQPQGSGYVPQPQSPEEIGVPTCSLGSECGTPILIASACKSVHTLCEDVGGVPTCVARDVFDQEGQICERRGGCYPPSECDALGRCQSSGAVDCTGNNTACETWVCADWPGGTC